MPPPQREQKRKNELTAQYEERTRQFDRELDQETEERIRKLREQADAAANARIQSQEKEAAQSIQQLERHYDAFHKDVCGPAVPGNDRGVVYREIL